MKKKAFTIIPLVLLIFAAFVIAVHSNRSHTDTPYTYEPCEDFINISVTFAGNGTNTRAFSFMTEVGTYDDTCVVQLDPVSKEETKPVFNSEDNMVITAFSEELLIYDYYSVHKAFTEDLDAGTKYFYRVGSPINKKWSDYGSFLTDDGDDAFSFLHITDSQAANEKEYAGFAETLRKSLADNPQSEFLLSTGDQVEYGYIQEFWDRFFASIKDEVMNTTFAAVNGNHEHVSTYMYANFYVPTDNELLYYYAYEYGDCLFMVLDTNTFNFTPQLEFMSSVMSVSTKKWRIVAAHKSPYSTGTHADDMDVLAFKNAITPFAANNDIDLVLGGHDHIYARTCPIDAAGNRAQNEDTVIQDQDGYQTTSYVNPGGTVYVVSRCTGTKFYNNVNSLNDHLIERGDPSKIEIPLFSAVTIEGNKLTYTAYEYYIGTTKETAVYDCFEIVKTNPRSIT